MQMRLNIRLIIAGFLLLLVAAACQSSPQTEYLLEVTREVTVVVVVTATPDDGTPEAVTDTADGTTEIPAALPTEASTVEIIPAQASDLLPTPIMNQIIVAEQIFERGRMFYLQPNDRIWVALYAEDGLNQEIGTWLIREDTWREGLPEFDPSINPPEDLYQPERGFGKLWREDTELQEALGWALEPEQGHVTLYQYFAGGEVNAAGQYMPAPGTHTVNSVYGGTYVFEEINSTWGLAAIQN